MIKRFLLLLLLCFTVVHFLPVFAKTIECDISFDWISKTQLQRDETINRIQNTVFNDNVILKYPKNEFKNNYLNYLKDKAWKEHYVSILNGSKGDSEKNYSAFTFKNGILYMYALQYKNNPRNIYYYDAIGNLRYVDVVSENYPKFPYISRQYNLNGKLVGTIYFVSEFDQYVFNKNMTFKGLWYKEKLYDRNAKVILYRSNYFNY